MRKLLLSIRHLLTYSVITSVMLVILLATFYATIYYTMSDIAGSVRHLQTMAFMAVVITSFVGIAVGSALRVFRSHYLWQISTNYRLHLGLATLVILATANLSFVFPAIEHWEQFGQFFALPFCVGLCVLYFNFADSLVERIAWPLTPMAISQLWRVGLDLEQMMIIIHLVALFLVYRLFNAQRYSTQSIDMHGEGREQSEVDWINLKHKLNAFFGRFVLRSMSKGGGDITWSISDPLGRMGALTLMNAAVVVFFLSIRGNADNTAAETLVLMFVSMSPLSVMLHARQYIGQLKSIAHLYTGENFLNFKREVLYGLYRLVIRDSSILILIIFSVMYMMGLGISAVFMNLILAIILLASSLVPLWLMIDWKKVNMALLTTVSAYFGGIISVAYYFRQQEDTALLSQQHGFYVILYIMLLVTLWLSFKRLYLSCRIERILL